MLSIIVCLSLFAASLVQAQPAPRAALEMPLSTKAVFLDLVTHENTIFAVGERGIILKSSDQREGWIQVPSPVDITLTSISFASRNEGWAVGHESTILHTVDGGNTWKVNRYKPEDERFYMSVKFFSEKLGYVLGTDGELWVTEDAGKSWQLTILSVEEWYQNHLFSIEKMDESAIVIGERGGVFTSTDGLTEWQPLVSPYEGSFFGINKIEDQFVAFGMSGKLYLINSASLAWKKIETNTDQFLLQSVVTEDGEYVFIVGRGGIILVLNKDGKLINTHQSESRVDYTAVTILNETVYLASMVGGITTISISDLIK